MRRLPLWLAACLLATIAGTLLVLSGRGDLADRGQAQVRAEEQRIEALIPQSQPWGQSSWQCRVRLLRHHDSTSWAWTLCRGNPGPEAFASPVRVDGENVWLPEDGAVIDGLKAHFPDDLVEVALTGNNQFLAELGLPVGGELPDPLPSS
jgi:hypothetical protein